MPVIRRLHPADHAAVLRINATSVPAVAQLDAHELQRLAAIGELHFVALDDYGIVLGYMLAFASDDPYDGSEFRHLCARLSQPFLYVDQLAVGESGQRRGIGQAPYESVDDGRSVVLLTRDTSRFN